MYHVIRRDSARLLIKYDTSTNSYYITECPYMSQTTTRLSRTSLEKTTKTETNKKQQREGPNVYASI